MVRGRAVAWGVLAATTSGCGVLGLKGIDTAASSKDTAAIAANISILSVSPNVGALDTATEVSIRGTGFEGK
jgi:hypothetical protein